MVGIAGRTGDGRSFTGASMASLPFADRAGTGGQEAGRACSRQSRGDSPSITTNMPRGEELVRPQAGGGRDPDRRTPPALPPELRERALDIGACEAAAGRGRVPHDRLSGGSCIDFPYGACAGAPSECDHPIACADTTGGKRPPRDQPLGGTARSAKTVAIGGLCANRGILPSVLSSADD